MAKGKLILICHSGGEFVTNDDATMSYKGGEANAINVTSETLFNDLKLQLAEACNFDQKTLTIKYFLPQNKKTLIILKNDKDVRRMIDFYEDAYTAEVFVTGTPGFEDIAINMQSNYNNEVLNLDNVGKKIKEPVKRGRPCTKKDDTVLATPQVKRTRHATAAAAKTAVASDENQDVGTDMSDGGKSDASANETSLNDSSDYVCEKEDSDSGSDYRPKRSPVQRKCNSQSEINIGVESSPADTVKNRRCTPSWKFGPNGRPTIVSIPDEDSPGPKYSGKSEKAENSGRNSLGKSSRLAAKGDHALPETVSDYALPETVDDSWNLAITGVGQKFDSVNEFRAALKKYAIANRFGYRLRKNDKTRAIGECAAEGCSWKISANWVPMFQSFMIKKLNNVHTCDKNSWISTPSARNWLVSTIKDRLRELPYLKPKEIANGLLQSFGVEVNYSRVRRGIGSARELLHGSATDSYNKLPFFCESLVKTNPGSIANLVISNKNRFKSLFISFYASVDGFQKGCRPLIFLEAASLKSIYGEILFTATAVDGNDGFFTVAFAIVDVEDDDNWRWFLEQLKASIVNSRSITFVIDRDKNLKNSVHAVFENAYVGYSIYHLLASFKRNLKGPFHKDGKGFLPVHLLAAAHAVHPAGFKKSTEHIKLISSQAYDWVMQSEPENWATSSFKGEPYNHIIEDVGDSYAKLMEDKRHLPILPKIDALIHMMIDHLEDAKLNASKWSTQLTASMQKVLEEEKAKAHGLKVLISSDTLFEVREDSTHVVNVTDQSCTCMRWKGRGLPCCHAIAVFSLTGKNLYDFCSSYFTADAYRLTYAEFIHPIPIDGQPQRNPKETPQNLKGEKEECGMEDVNKETGERREKEDNSMEETYRAEINMEELENMKVQKDVSIKKGNEVKGSNTQKEGCKLDADKVEGGDVDAQKDEGADQDVRKDEGISVHVDKVREIDVVDVEELEDVNVDVEKDEDVNADVEGIIENVLKDVVGNVDTDKHEGGTMDAEKDGGGNVDSETEEVSDLDAEKEDSNTGKLQEEHEDPYVLVLPPIPAKLSSSFMKK
uniref:uncharacterized protein LOC122593734 n=1 Tax=Erigeron canadensis TaxID=72917 RepID=UPI001CB95469|nr:uncharacterized protein LOC122593734 [Erigeron canadensis]